MFTRTLIDKYILPMVEQVKAGQGSPDFSPLLRAMARVACFYLVGIGSAYLQARTMAFVTQGTMKRLRRSTGSSRRVRLFDTLCERNFLM
jgi:ATP-binding cassette subfamily B protein